MAYWLLKRLYSDDVDDSKAAARDIRVLPPDQLLTVLREEARWMRIYNRQYACCILSMMAVFICGWLWAYQCADSLAPVLALCVVGISMLFVFTISFFYKDARAHRIALEIVTETAENVGYLGITLTLLAQIPDNETASKLRAIVGKMLVGLRADQSRLLHDEERQMLRSLLNHENWDVKLTLSILKALEQIGTPEDIPAVEKLIWRVSPNSKLGDAARECLFYLQQRETEQKYTQSLLRPSNQTETAPETLLRAAVAGNEVTASEQLLRPQ